MGHTNTTTNYGLPQFITSDKPAWLTDINGAFSDTDTAIYNAKAAADAAQNDATQALTDAGTAASTASTADNKASGAVASIEAAFDPTTIYAVGAKVMYNSLLYRCTVAVVTPGPWTGAANWERITVDSLIPNNATELDLTSDPTDGTVEAAIADLNTEVATKATLSIVSTSLSLAGTKTAFTDIAIDASKIIPGSAILSADAGVPVTLSVQAVSAGLSRIRVSANAAYTSSVNITYFVIS